MGGGGHRSWAGYVPCGIKTSPIIFLGFVKKLDLSRREERFIPLLQTGYIKKLMYFYFTVNTKQ